MSLQKKINPNWVYIKPKINRQAIQKWQNYKHRLTLLVIIVHVQRSEERVKHKESNHGVDGADNDCCPLVRTPFPSSPAAVTPAQPLSTSRHLPQQKSIKFVNISVPSPSTQLPLRPIISFYNMEYLSTCPVEEAKTATCNNEEIKRECFIEILQIFGNCGLGIREIGSINLTSSCLG